ncbi:hypothetical protein Tco_0870198 [Tanacetum coccineum]
MANDWLLIAWESKPRTQQTPDCNILRSTNAGETRGFKKHRTPNLVHQSLVRYLNLELTPDEPPPDLVLTLQFDTCRIGIRTSDLPPCHLHNQSLVGPTATSLLTWRSMSINGLVNGGQPPPDRQSTTTRPPVNHHRTTGQPPPDRQSTTTGPPVNHHRTTGQRR